MATSRYVTSPNSNTSGIDNVQSSTGSGTTGTVGQQTQNTSGQQTTNTNQTQTTNQTTQNMSAGNQAALERLIQQLLGGGTPEIKQQQARRTQEQAQVGNIREAYSKPAAFADAQGLISQQMRRTLESLLPSINAAAEGSGSSGGAMRALLLQDAANKAAESSSALGVQTATQYGGIAANLSQVMEQLTRIDPANTQALIAALNAAKGATQTTNGTVQTTGTQVTNTNQTGSTNTNQQGTTQEQKTINTDYAPFAVSTAPVMFGPVAGPDPSKYVGTTVDTLRQLAGGAGSRWSDYTF